MNIPVWTLMVIGYVYFLNSKWCKNLNPVMAKCPACKAKLTKFAWGWVWQIGDWTLWISFLVLTGIGRLHFTGLNLLMVFGISMTWNVARNRLYHNYWLWRHPLRCEKGGHAEPQLEGTSA